MSNGETYGSDKLKPAVRRKRWVFFVPLLFFALGPRALGYTHWYAGRGAGGMKTASSGTAEQVLPPEKSSLRFFTMSIP